MAFRKNISPLKEHLASVDSALNTIRKSGAGSFILDLTHKTLAKYPCYLMIERVGIQWRGIPLEEKLTKAYLGQIVYFG